MAVKNSYIEKIMEKLNTLDVYKVILFGSYANDKADEESDIDQTYGDWVAWIGRWDDLIEGTDGDLLVRLMDNLPNANGSVSDCAYPALEVLPDGTVVATTYGHWIAGEAPFILSVRFTPEELETMVIGGRA